MKVLIGFGLICVAAFVLFWSATLFFAVGIAKWAWHIW